MEPRNRNEQEYDQFMMTFGKSIQFWQHVEVGMFTTYMALISNDILSYYNLVSVPNLSSAAAYHAILSFKSQCDMVDAAARVRLSGHKRMLCRWHILLKRCIGQAKIRNRLAHHMMYVTISADDLARFNLAPSTLDPLSNPNESYSKLQMEQFAKDFFDLGMKLTKFQQDVIRILYSSWRGRPPEQSGGRKT